MIRWLLDRLNVWVLLGTLIVAGGLVVLAVALVYLVPKPAQPERSSAALTRIPGPTPTYTLPAISPTPTPTQPVSVGGISVGMYVQISGTEGQGLRLREAAGTSQALRFVGMDAEVFQVKDGPQEADGYTWWYLEAPYDPNRAGWAASQYLAIVNQPETPTPQP
jgi:hypothetical protein